MTTVIGICTRNRRCNKMAFGSVFVSLFVLVIAVFVMYPAPKLSKDLQHWKDQGEYFDYGGNQIFYLDAKGKGKAEDVVLVLHGYPTSTYDFYKVWDKLKGRFGRVVSADYIGYGFSEKPRDFKYSLFHSADMVTALLKKLNIPNVHIFAHDVGDTVAQELLARDSELKAGKQKPPFTIHSVCLLNGGLFPEAYEAAFLQKVLLNEWAAPIAMRLMNRELFGPSLSETFGPNTQPSTEELDDLWAAIRYNDGHLVQHGVIQYLHERTRYRDRWVNALANTKLPLHLIYGDADPINPAPTFLVRYKELIPNSGVTELPSGIGHYPQVEDPDNVIKAYFKFLDSLKKT